MNERADKIKFAIVGYGHIGRRHAAMILNNPNAELVAVCDNDPMQALQGENQGVVFFDSLNILLESGPAFDVLSIATPNGLTAIRLNARLTGHHPAHLQ